jgi:hypothetical protein
MSASADFSFSPFTTTPSLPTLLQRLQKLTPEPFCIFCQLVLLRQSIQAVSPTLWHLRWRRVCSFLGDGHYQFLPPPLHLILHRDLPKRWKAADRPQGRPIAQRCRATRHCGPYPRNDYPGYFKRTCHYDGNTGPPSHSISQSLGLRTLHLWIIP